MQLPGAIYVAREIGRDRRAQVMTCQVAVGSQSQRFNSLVEKTRRETCRGWTDDLRGIGVETRVSEHGISRCE